MPNIRSMLIAALALFLVACDSPEEEAEAALVEQAEAIHDSVLTIDTHVDIPLNFATDEADPADRPDAQVDLAGMEAGGLDAVFFIVYVGQAERTEENYASARADAMTKFEAIHRMTDEMYSDRIGLATTADEVRAIHDSGRLVALIGMENGFVIGEDISLLRTYYDLGGRYLTLVHNGHNDIGDSAQAREALGDLPEEHGGLSEFGGEVIDEMNRLGIMVDISHVSRQTMLDATQRSRTPVIASHSGVTGVAIHPRNLDDTQLLALARNGGVAQIIAFDSYLTEVPEEKSSALAALREESGLTSPAAFRDLSDEERDAFQARVAEINAQWPGSTVSDFVDHIDYAVQLIGIDHVGISSDFGGGGGVEGWNNARETFNVTLELVRRGYSVEEISKLWGANILRVMEEVELFAILSNQ